MTAGSAVAAPPASTVALRRSFLLLPATLLVLTASWTAQAQSAPQAGKADQRETRVIEEVIVTARKKAESIQDVPMSITALDGEQLSERGIENIHELAELTPNVRFFTNACCTTVFIRGFGSPSAGGTFDPTVGIAIDELSLGREIYMSDPLFDLAQFEVLRGPQGTLFGKNTPGGIFNIKTNQPSPEWTTALLAKTGGLDVHRVELAVGGPLTDSDALQFRFAALDSRQAGDVENTALDINEPDTEQQAARLLLSYKPTQALGFTFKGARAETESRHFHVQSDSFRQSTIDFLRNYDPEFEDDPYDHQNSINHPEGIARQTDLLQLNTQWTPGGFGPISNPAFIVIAAVTGFDMTLPLDVDLSPADILTLTPYDYFYDQKSIEVRGSGNLPGIFGLGESEFLLGVQLLNADTKTLIDAVAGEHFEDYLTSPAAFELVTGSQPPAGIGFSDLASAAAALGIAPPPGPLRGDGARFFLDQKTSARSLFGRFAWSINSRWTLSFGARVTREVKDAHLLTRCFEPGVVCAALAIEAFEAHKEIDDTDFSPKVTLQYFPSDNLSLFVTRAQGFKSGGFNNLNFGPDEVQVDSEKATSWETGVKGTFFERSLSLAATLFDMEIEELQLQNTVGALVLIRNAGAARSRGLEIEGQWLTPWPALSIRFAGSITDGRFLEYENAPAVAGSGQSSQDLSGRRMPFLPKRQLTVTPELEWPLPFLKRWFDVTGFMAADILHRSNFYLDSDLDPHVLQSDYTKVDLRTGLRSTDGNFSLALAVTNLTDHDAREWANDSILFPGGYVAIQEFQRNWSLQTQWNF